MFSLVFMICLNGSPECQTLAPEDVFSTVAQCESMAELILMNVQQEVDRGALAPHTSHYVCVGWGDPV